MKPLVYPFSYDEWLAHPSSKPKLKWIKKVCDEIKLEKNHGIQLELTI